VRKKRVVVIDDEQDIVTFLTTALLDNGFEVNFAEDAVKGMDIIREFKPDLICLDILMPGRTGMSIYHEIKEDENFRSIPVLIVSGLKKEEVLKDMNFKELEPEDLYLEKPVSPDDFIANVKKMIERD